MVDPILTYVGGIAFLVLIIGSMLYLTFSTLDIEEGDEHPGESVVGGVEEEEEESEHADPLSEGSPELVDDDSANREGTEEADTEADQPDGNAEDQPDGSTNENA